MKIQESDRIVSALLAATSATDEDVIASCREELRSAIEEAIIHEVDRELARQHLLQSELKDEHVQPPLEQGPAGTT